MTEPQSPAQLTEMPEDAAFTARVQAVMDGYNADTFEVSVDPAEDGQTVFRLLKDNQFVTEGTLSDLESALLPKDADAPALAGPDSVPVVQVEAEAPVEVEAVAPPTHSGLTSEPDNA